MPTRRPSATATLLLSTLCAALLTTMARPAQAQSLISNGSFDTDLSGWTATSVTRSLFGTAFFDAASDRLTQSFHVLAGQSYVLNFDYSATGPGTANGLRLDFNGAGYATPSAIVYHATGGAVSSVSYSFTAAASGNSVLRFLGTNRNALLDNVSITAVPEAPGGLMMLAGLGAIAFMSRRRVAGGDARA